MTSSTEVLRSLTRSVSLGPTSPKSLLPSFPLSVMHTLEMPFLACVTRVAQTLCDGPGTPFLSCYIGTFQRDLQESARLMSGRRDVFRQAYLECFKVCQRGFWAQCCWRNHESWGVAFDGGDYGHLLFQGHVVVQEANPTTLHPSNSLLRRGQKFCFRRSRFPSLQQFSGDGLSENILQKCSIVLILSVLTKMHQIPSAK